MSNEELKQIIQGVIGNDDPFWNNQIFVILTKIINLSEGVETTIGQLIDYNPSENNVAPLIQGQIFDIVMNVCKKINMPLEEVNNEEFIGLAYNYKFKKVTGSIFTSYVNMNSFEIKNLISQKLELLKDKINGNIDEKEQNNVGYLFWNCKMIFRNIYMAYDKLTNKFKDELSAEEIIDFANKSNIIKSNENNWKDINDIKLTYNQIVGICNDSNKEQNNLLKCPSCGEKLMFMMPDGKTLHCNKCNKYYKNENNAVGDETSSPYSDNNVLY